MSDNQETAPSEPVETLAPATTQEQAQPETDALPDTAAETGAADADAERQPEAPKRDKAAERIGELTRKQREAERERDLYRQMLERQIAQQPQPAQAQPPQADKAPEPKDFPGGEYDPGYLDALTDYRATQAVEKRFRVMAEQQQRQRAQSEWEQRVQSFAERETRIRAEMPEYDDLAARAGTLIHRQNPHVAAAVADAVADEENGPDVLAYLGQNEEQARRIASMRPVAAAREIGRVAERLKVQREAAAKTVTSAPPPPATVGAGQGAGTSSNPLTESDEQFRARMQRIRAAQV